MKKNTVSSNVVNRAIALYGVGALILALTLVVWTASIATATEKRALLVSMLLILGVTALFFANLGERQARSEKLEKLDREKLAKALEHTATILWLIVKIGSVIMGILTILLLLKISVLM